MDPLSIASGVTGVLAFAASTAHSLYSLVQEIREAPEDIAVIGRDVQALAAVLASAQNTCTKYGISSEDEALAIALGDYLKTCQEAMKGMHDILKPLSSSNGVGRRSPMRFAISWTMKKGEVKALRGRLNEGKASLNLTLSALNGLLEGKGQEDIRADIQKVFVELINEFRNLEAGKKVRRRIEDDVASVSMSTARRKSMSGITDHDFSMRRFLQPADENKVTSDTKATLVDSNGAPGEYLSPWSSDPNAILEAVQSQNRRLVETLLAEGASLSVRSAQGYTVLHFCAITNDMETAALLIQHGADVNAKDYELRSPFRLALASEALGVACLLAERGCVVGDSSTTLLGLMARPEEVPGIRQLIQTLAKRLDATDQGPFLLHSAIGEHEKRVVDLLLDEGFSVSKVDHRGVTPFHHAFRCNNKPVMRILAHRGADVNEKIPRHVIDEVGLPDGWYAATLTDNNHGCTPLFLAARYKRDEGMTKLILDLGADPDAPLWEGMGGIPLVGICAMEYSAQAKRLVEYGSKINQVPSDGRGAMYWTAFCNNGDLMQCLIAHGGDVNYQRPQDGTTPLMLAAARGNMKMVKMLLEAGADPARVDKDGRTALLIAEGHGKRDVFATLQPAMASKSV